MRLVVTGATGFMGTALCQVAGAAGHALVPVGHRQRGAEDGDLVRLEIDGRTDWRQTLCGADAIIHLAARVHVMRERATDPLAAFRAVNVEGSRRLAQAAATAGVRRLVLVSTIKVLGEVTTGRPFGPRDAAAPVDAYSQSKLEAEAAVREVSHATGLEVVIVRPPLVHGPGAGGNLRRLMALVWRGVPLPLGAVRNRRSLVGVRNLVALLLVAAAHPRAAGQILLVADQPPVSTAALVSLIARRMARPSRLWPVSTTLLRGLGRASGRRHETERLLESLEVDDAYTRSLLEWSPPVTLEDGIGAMVDSYLRDQLGGSRAR